MGNGPLAISESISLAHESMTIFRDKDHTGKPPVTKRGLRGVVYRTL